MSDSEIAAAFDLSLPFVQAIRAVESGGIPSAVRFEPHVWKRFHPDTVRLLTRGGPDLDRLAAWKAGLIPYTPGELRSASPIRAETDRAAFQRAFAIDPAAAIRSTSFGSFQVLGAHLLGLHNGDPAAALAAFDANPARESDRLLIAWLHANPAAVTAARERNVVEWVRRYNGSTGAAAVKYIGRMHRALAAAGWPQTG